MTDEKLVEAWQGGDEVAFAEIFRRYNGRILAFITRIVGDSHRAEELVQEVFVRVVTHSRTFDGREAKFSTWLFQIARNLSLNAIRDRGRRREDTMADETFPQAGRQSPSIEGRLAVDHLLQKLPEEQRSVFVLKHDQDLKYQEIAEVLNIPIGTVKSRMHAAIGTLRTALQGARP